MTDESPRERTDDDFFDALSREGIHAGRMGALYGIANYPHLDRYKPIDAYVAGFQDGVRAALGLMAAHQDCPGTLDQMELFRRLCDIDAAAPLRTLGRR